MKVSDTSGVNLIKAYTSRIKQQGKGAHRTEAGEDKKGDTVELSAEARELQTFKNELRRLSEVREELVNSLKEKLRDGSYRPDAEKIADGMIAERKLEFGGNSE